MKDLRYRYNGNNHFNENVYHDTIRLMDKIVVFYKLHGIIPTDDMIIHTYHWTRDHINRCYQMLKEMGVVTYARNHRRTTLQFLDKYKYLNEKKKD